jgi:hypothetical protein
VSTAASSVPLRQTRAKVRADAPSAPAIAGLLVLALAVALFLLYALWEFWPTAAILSVQSASPVHLLGVHRHVSTEVRLFVVVAISGALGGLLHSTRSFAWYVGHDGLRWRWVPYYVVTLAVGAGLATIVYVVIRGGMFSGRTATADVNPYGFAAIGAIVGLYSEQALEMLHKVATDFFADAPQGPDGTAEVAAAAAQSPDGDVAKLDLPDALPPLARTGQATGIEQTAATLSGFVTPNGVPVSYRFEYGPTTEYGSSTEAAEVDSSGSGDVTAPVADLLPATLYHFRLVLDGPEGGAAGADNTFTTAGA